jgi:[protein-PII] uridylyltransferase
VPHKSTIETNSCKKDLRKVEVLFDNTTSSVYTIVDIFSSDRIGLLYDILGVFAAHRLDVRYAKISTDVDSVVDSFSLTHVGGEKILDEKELERLKKAIYEIT